MATRSFVRSAVIVRNLDGSALLVEQALVSMFVHGTSTPIPVFDVADGGAPLTQPIRSDATGQITFWADLGAAPLFDVFVQSDGLTVRAGTPRPVSFPPFAEALPSPSSVGAGDAGSVPMAAYPLLSLLARGVESGVVLIPGDSTSDDGSGATLGSPTRWPLPWSLLMAADWPAYTVTFQQWQDASGTPTFSWPAPTIVQAGPAGLTTHAAATGSAASATITDPAIGSGDLGKRVIGTNIPPRACVGTVTPGVSYTLVDSSNSFAAPVYPWGTVSGVKLGADPVLHVYGASVAATRWLYGFGVHLDAQYTRVHPDIIIANHGHNEVHVAGAFAPTNGLEVFRNDYLCGIGMLESVCPGVPIIVTVQNPRTDVAGAADAPIKARLIAALAASRGYQVIDVFQTFIDYGNWSADLMAVDGVHPSPAGSTLWAQEAHRPFVVPHDRRGIPRGVATPIFQVAAPEQLAPGLLDFLASGILPAGWTLTNATVAVDTIGDVTAAKVISTDVLGRLEIPLNLAKVAGQTITATVRCQAAVSANNCAVGIRWHDANGVAHTEQSDYAVGNALNSWHYQSISKAIPADALDVSIWVYGNAGAAGVTTADPTWYRSIVVHRGATPAGPLPSATASPLVSGAVTDSFVAPAALIQPPKISGLGDAFGCVGPALPGVAGSWFSTPSVAANQITGAIEFKALLPKGLGTRPSGQEAILAKWGGPGSRAYAFQLNPSGAIAISWSEDGTNAKPPANSAAGVLAATLAADVYVKATLDPNVAGNYQIKFWTSPDDSSWSQLGATVNGTGTTSIFDAATQPVEVGSLGTNTSQFFAGGILMASIAPSIGGGAAQKFQFTTPASATFMATTGEVWTVHGAMSWLYRFLDPLVLPGVVYGARGIGAGNTSAATTPGAVVKKLPIFAADGTTVLGFVPLYDAIT